MGEVYRHTDADEDEVSVLYSNPCISDMNRAYASSLVGFWGCAPLDSPEVSVGVRSLRSLRVNTGHLGAALVRAGNATFRR